MAARPALATDVFLRLTTANLTTDTYAQTLQVATELMENDDFRQKMHEPIAVKAVLRALSSRHQLCVTNAVELILKLRIHTQDILFDT